VKTDRTMITDSR